MLSIALCPQGVAHSFPKWTILYTKFSVFPHFLGRDRGFCRDILGILGQLNHREKSGQPPDSRLSFDA